MIVFYKRLLKQFTLFKLKMAADNNVSNMRRSATFEKSRDDVRCERW